MSAREQPQIAFGDWLRQRRQALDLTREELARQVGCSTITLRKLEAEERRPSKPMADRLAEVLQIAPDDRPAFLRFARGDPFAAPPGPETGERSGPPPTPRHNLPLQLSSFIGREREVAAIQRLITPPGGMPEAPFPGDNPAIGVRLLTLTGPGGAGKTRLALQVAAGLLDQFADGAWLVELAPLADASLVPQTAAGALGLKEMPGQPILAVLQNYLRSKRLLLVLDNCEHLIRACAELAETLLRVCPHLRLLASSRESLGLAGETLYQVPALSVPDPNENDRVEKVAQSEAGQLFAERARAVLPGFGVTSDNASAVAQICRDLDGLPLAIELAAARVKVLEVEQIAKRLNERFRLLTGGSRTAMPRHQTLQALIDWSYDLLPVPEQTLLQRLAVFVAGWTLEAAEAVGKDKDPAQRTAGLGEGRSLKDEENPSAWLQPSDFRLQPSEVLDLLTQLANKSLVVVERQPGQPVRYRLLETIREYALAKLAASGETDTIWRRLAEYYIEQVKTHQSSDPSGGMLAEDPRLAPELDNLRAVLAWSHSTAGAEDLGLRLAGSVMGLWIERGHWNEARGFLEAALRRAPSTAEAAARARVLNGLGTLAYFQGQYAVGVAYLLESLAVSRELKDRLMVGATLNMLGEVAVEQGDAVDALPRYQESLALFRDIGNSKGVVWATMNLGELAVMQEDVQGARARFEESLALCREIAEPAFMAWALHGLGLTAQLEGDFAHAQQLHSQSLERYREYGEPNQFIPWAYHGLGQTALAQGDATAAARHLADALRLFHDEGDRGGVSFCLAGLAGAAALDEELERAAQLWGAAEALRQSIGTRQAPATRATRERLMAMAREKLGEEALSAAWAEGQKMTMELAIELALEGA